MAIQTNQEYHSSESNFGKYQYISMFDIVNELLSDTIDPDHYLTNTRRSTLVRKTKEGIRVLNREIKKTILAVEITVGPKQYLALPQDYMDWVRVSVVGPQYKLHPLNINYDIPTATGYLQDNDYNLLFDNNGEIQTADSSNHFNKPYKTYTFCEADKSYLNAEFVIDEPRGVIGFTGELIGKEIVIEYISDGIQMGELKEEEVTVHKNIKEVLLKCVYMACIIGKRTAR
jgi:hypothetical protein